MKGYYGKKELRLTGKAWEVRAKLKQWAAGADRTTRLQDWLSRRGA